MKQTIRDYLKVRVRWGLGIAAAAWLCVPVGMELLRTEGPGGHTGLPPPLAFGGMLIMVAAMGWMYYFVRCPRCKIRLGNLGFQVGLGFLRPVPNFCPYCGVSLDEPFEKHTAPGQQATFNPIR